MFDKRYLKPDFIWQRLRKGPRVKWKNLTDEQRAFVEKRCVELNLTIHQRKEGTGIRREFRGPATTGTIEHVVDFGWKSEPQTAEWLIDMIDRQIFDDVLSSNPGLVIAAIVRDLDALQEAVEFTEHSKIYEALYTGRPKSELN